MMEESIIEEIEGSAATLEKVFTGIDEAKINTTPFPGSWTPAQLMDHLLRSQKGVLDLVQGSTATAGRPVDALINTLKEIFLDFTKKMESPAFVRPTSEPLEKGSILKRLGEIQVRIQQLTGKDLSLLCVDAPFPGFDFMTRLELLHFFLYHTQRHTVQLENMVREMRVSRKDAK